MTSLYTYDAAYQPKLATVAKAPGALAINGYLTGMYANTTTQPAAARKAGLGYVATYEEGRSELVGASRATGRRVGDKIIAAFRAKGIPITPDIAVYPSVDVNVPIDGPDRDSDQCNTGWEGIRDVIDGAISVRSYAEGAIIKALAAAGLVDGKCWLAAPTSWAGFDVNDPHICMVQLVGTNVPGTDRNHLITDPHAIGAWWPDGSPYGGNMALDPKDPVIVALNAKIDRVYSRIWESVAVVVNGDAGHPNSQAAIGPLVRTLAAVLGQPDGVAPRVAAIQAAIDQLQTAVAGITPAEVAQLDADQVASKVLTALNGATLQVKA